MKTPLYKRVLLKLSGQSLQGKSSYGIDPEVLDLVVDEIASVQDLDVQIAIVLGAGNLWRGADTQHLPLDRAQSDSLGMLATITNSVVLGSALQRSGVQAAVYSAYDIPAVAELYAAPRVRSALDSGQIVLCAGGTGCPYFTTDSAATLRALELECDIVLKATRVDGVYDSDPETNPTAQKHEKISYDEVLNQNLRVMDATAIAQCREYQMPLRVFGFGQEGALREILTSEDRGTLVHP